MLKKILITIAVILIIAVIGLLIWAFMISRQSGGEVTVTESFRELVSFGEGGTNPFPERGTDEFDIVPSGVDDILDDNASLPRLRQIANFPVAGATIVENEDGKTLIRFIARENGHIFDVPVDSTTQKRISNTTILRIQDAKWLSGGDAFIARFLDEDSSQIESFYAEINQNQITSTTTASEGSLSGSFLQSDIKELTLSDDDKIFYLTASGNGSIGIISDADGDKKVQVLDSPLSGWNIQWRNGNQGNKISLTTKASSGALGYLYFLDSKTKNIEKILSAIAGLTTLINKDATRVLFTHNDSNRLLLSSLDVKSGEIIDLPIWTLSEKCVWSELNEDIIYCGVPNTLAQASDLDLWYQGLASFSDSVWMIDIETQTADVLSNPEDASGENIDIIKPILSEDENYLIFTNKKDSTLWSLQLK